MKKQADSLMVTTTVAVEKRELVVQEFIVDSRKAGGAAWPGLARRIAAAKPKKAAASAKVRAKKVKGRKI